MSGRFRLEEFSARTVIAAARAVEYGIRDEGGRQPPSSRDLHGVAPSQPSPVVSR